MDSNIVNEKPTKKSGLYKTGFRHKDGGIFVLVDSVKPIETEVLEYHIPRKMILNTKNYSFKNKTNLEMLDYIFQDNDVEFTQGVAESQDHIVCRLAVLDKTKKDFNGSCLDLFNLIQGEHGCRLSENEAHDYKHRLGGSISPTDTDIDSIKEKIKKVEDVNLYLQKYISENEKNILDLKVKDYKKQISVNKKTIKSYKDRIKEVSKNENESISDFDNLLIEGEHKKAKVEKEANSRVYIRFEDGTSEIISKEKYDKYKNDFNKNLEKGIKVEEEHRDTVEKLAKGEISADEGVKEIAQKHLSEDSDYYEKLEEVENPFGIFIEIVKSSKDFDDAFSKVKKIKDVPSFIADEFSDKYNPDGKLSMEKAFKVFYDKHKGDDLEFKVTEQELPYKGNPNAKWVKVTYITKDGETLMQGVAIDLYGSKEKAIEAAKEKIKSILKKESDKQELKDLIDLFKEAVKENPNDQESKDLLELYEENLKEFDSKFEDGGELNAEEAIINAPCINEKFKFVESSDYNEYRKGGSINSMSKKELEAFYNTKEGKELDRQTYNKWKKLVNMSKSELEKFYNSEEGKEAGLSASEAKEKGIDSGRESARWIMKMKDIPYTEWTSDMWIWAKKQISFISRMSGVKGDLYDDKGNKTPKYKSLMIWGNNPEKYEDGGKIEVNKVSVYQTNFSGLSFSDLGGYFDSNFTDVIDLEDENVILKDAPIFLFFKNPYDTRYSEKISIDDVIGAIIPKKMEKDARNIFDKHFISYVAYSDDANTENKIEAIKKLADINDDIILK